MRFRLIIGALLISSWQLSIANEISVKSTVGGNFERLDTSGSVLLENEVILTPVLTLYDLSVSEGNKATAQITASFSHQPKSNLEITLNNGAKLLFTSDYEAGNYIKSSSFDLNNEEDIYKDHSSFELFVLSSKGGGLGSIDTSDTATVRVNDTVDAAKLTLHGIVALEDSKTQKMVQASLNKTPENEMVVTLENGATLVFDENYVPGNKVNSTPFIIEENTGEEKGEVLVTNKSNAGNTFAYTKRASLDAGTYDGSGINLLVDLFTNDQFVATAGYLTGSLSATSINALSENTLNGIATANVKRDAEFTAIQAGTRYNALYFSSSLHLYAKGGLALWTMDYTNTNGITANPVAVGAVDTSADDIAAADAVLLAKYPSESNSGQSIYVGFGINYFITDTMFIGYDFANYYKAPVKLNSRGLFFGLVF